MSIKGITSNRNVYDLSHFSMNVGKIGCLQTIATVPVVAGDSMELNLESVFRLSPLRRPLYLDAMVDLFAFFVPHRHVYSKYQGEVDTVGNWLDFIKEGIDEAQTFGTITNNASVETHCLGTHIPVSTAFPKWLGHGYAQIYNRFFKNPGSTDMALTFFNVNTDARNYYGQLCCFPKRSFNCAMLTTNSDAEDTYTNAGTVNDTVVDLVEFAKQQGRYKSELKRDWFGQRYADLMNELFGSKISEEVEPFPYLLARKTSYLSGYETDGTSGDSMGMFQARSVGVADLRFPYKFFDEHGCIWVMALVRFPVIDYNEAHWLTLPEQSEFTYKEIAGDPDIVSKEGAVVVDGEDFWFTSSDNNSMGELPHSWWYREHPNFVHPDYLLTDGHPFLNIAPDASVSTETPKYYTLTMYDYIFSTMQLAHWQCQSHVGLVAKRVVPDPRLNVFAGTN